VNLKLKKYKKPLLFLSKILCLTCLVVSIVCHISCRITEEGIQILSGDYTPPQITSFTVTGPSQLELSFSEKTCLKSAVVIEQDPVTGTKSVRPPDPADVAQQIQTNGIDVTEEYTDDGEKLRLFLIRPAETGLSYLLYGTIEDGNGNTLTFGIPFTGFNAHVPRIILNEIETKYAKLSDTAYRVEFIEVFALTGGNLSGLELYSAYDGSDKMYEFPAVTVKPGDYVTVHLRSKGDGCVSELDDDFSDSTAVWSCNSARDLWAGNTVSHLGDIQDVILLKNSANDRILDALLYTLEESGDWKSDEMRQAAQKAVACGVWDSTEPEHAVSSEGISVTRTLSRQNTEALFRAVSNGAAGTDIIPVSKNDWSVVKSSNATPGTANSAEVFEQ
jgi:hypothetical protein